MSSSYATPSTNPSARNAESPRSRHNTTSATISTATMATTPAFAFMGQGTSSATVAARVTPAAASGTTAAPTSTTMTTATSATAVAGVSTGAGITSSFPASTFTIPTWSNLASGAVTTTALPTTVASTPFSGLIFGTPAAPLAPTTTTPEITGGGATSFSFSTAGAAATSISAGGGTATGQIPAVPTTTTTTHTALRFTPARLPEAPSNVWGISTNSNPTATNLFGNQVAPMRLASAGTPPGPGRFFNNFATRPSLALATAQPSTASTSVFTPSIQNNGNQIPQLKCTKEIRFRFEWSPENISILLGTGYTQQFRVREGDVDTLQCSLLQTPDTFKMTLDFETNPKVGNPSWLQTVSTYTVDQNRLATVSVFWPGIRTVHLSWPKADMTLVKNAAGLYGVDVLLSSEKSGIKFHTTTSTTYTDHCDSILGKMLDDPSSYDVFFEFDPPESFSEFEDEIEASDSETGSIEKIEAEDDGHQQEDGTDVTGTKDAKSTTDTSNIEHTLKDTSESSSTTSLVDTNTTGQQVDNMNCGHDKDRSRDRRLEWTLDKAEFQDEEAYADAVGTQLLKSVKNAYTAMDNMKNVLIASPSTTLLKSRTATVETLGAHKIVLSQYEYFKTMFSSSFAEGGPGVKRIKIKDSDIHCFRLLIQFLYLGRLRTWNAPTVLTQDCVTLRHQPSWEDVYLIADRYNIPDLKVMAGTRIAQGLCSEWAVPFLFRTGYLFEEMRHALIKYVVKNNMDEISHKKTQEIYFAHPECTAIFGEIIAELWSNRSS
ncbi:MAG: hypothetical protein J3R72DRAFT_525558 [Linnemannia gamsii]|nr:MAG: hypothetical protein J3R72DRAFT_525558 [Linnemannia gamsii]